MRGLNALGIAGRVYAYGESAFTVLDEYKLALQSGDFGEFKFSIVRETSKLAGMELGAKVGAEIGLYLAGPEGGLVGGIVGGTVGMIAGPAGVYAARRQVAQLTAGLAAAKQNIIQNVTQHNVDPKQTTVEQIYRAATVPAGVKELGNSSRGEPPPSDEQRPGQFDPRRR